MQPICTAPPPQRNRPHRPLESVSLSQELKKFFFKKKMRKKKCERLLSDSRLTIGDIFFPSLSHG